MAGDAARAWARAGEPVVLGWRVPVRPFPALGEPAAGR
jgi:hypothetical protein